MNEIATQIVKLFDTNINYLENAEWSAHYNKYNEEKLGIKENWIYTISNLVSECLTDNLSCNYKKLKPFYEWLGERIQLSLNLNRGLTNGELKEMLKQKQDGTENENI